MSLKSPNDQHDKHLPNRDEQLQQCLVTSGIPEHERHLCYAVWAVIFVGWQFLTDLFKMHIALISHTNVGPLLSRSARDKDACVAIGQLIALAQCGWRQREATPPIVLLSPPQTRVINWGGMLWHVEVTISAWIWICACTSVLPPFTLSKKCCILATKSWLQLTKSLLKSMTSKSGLHF